MATERIFDYDEHLLVKRHRGTMPILLTCPHDGTETPEGVKQRTAEDTPDNCTGGERFNTGRDRHSATITQRVARQILERTGLSPYVVIARFDRKYIDANRSSTSSASSVPNCAFTDADARKYYDEYHKWIKTYIEEILAQNDNRGFLFDIHGTPQKENDRADVYLGTGTGTTLRPPLTREQLFLRHGLRGLLASARNRIVRHTAVPPFEDVSWKVSPANSSAEETLNGAFTIRHYKSSLSCIQIEIADTIRDDEVRRELFADDLAFAIPNFARRYVTF